MWRFWENQGLWDQKCFRTVHPPSLLSPASTHPSTRPTDLPSVHSSAVQKGKSRHYHTHLGASASKVTRFFKFTVKTLLQKAGYLQFFLGHLADSEIMPPEQKRHRTTKGVFLFCGLNFKPFCAKKSRDEVQ